MSKELDLGYYGIPFNSPAFKLAEVCGGRLEKIPNQDKLALIALLAAWTANNDEYYGFLEAMEGCQMTVSENFYLYVAILADPENCITSSDALGLIAALTAQLRSGAFVR